MEEDSHHPWCRPWSPGALESSNLQVFVDLTKMNLLKTRKFIEMSGVSPVILPPWRGELCINGTPRYLGETGKVDVGHAACSTWNWPCLESKLRRTWHGRETSWWTGAPSWTKNRMALVWRNGSTKSSLESKWLEGLGQLGKWSFLLYCT